MHKIGTVKKTFIERVQSFELLKDNIKIFINDYPNIDKNIFFHSIIFDAIEMQYQHNRWFTHEYAIQALEGIVFMLNESNIQTFTSFYQDLFTQEKEKNDTVLVISAGNIPLAAFHDFFSVLVSGSKFLGKLSAKDSILLPVLAELLSELDPYFKDKITFIENLQEYKKGNSSNGFDKVIATGSNNSSRYFEYYFSKTPLLLRKNRNSIAILDGNETPEQIKGLAKDIFSYFGLGCRSVSKLYLPKDFNFIYFIETIQNYSTYNSEHHLYLNNLEYQKTIYLMNRKHFYDAGSFMLVEDSSLSSPISIIHYEFYDSLPELVDSISPLTELMQCIVVENRLAREAIDRIAPSLSVGFGEGQSPSLLDFPDGVDIVKFCLS